jgi:hypothetical protein
MPVESNAQCPWSPLRDRYGAPNLDWCESADCAWIEEPANTWSNLAYLAVALALGLLARGDRRVMSLAWIAAFLGVASLLYHASNNGLTQFFDFLGMFVYVSRLLSWNCKRLAAWSWNRADYALAGLILANTALFFFVFPTLGWPVQWIILANSLLIIGQEILIRVRAPAAAGREYRYYAAGLGLLLVAAVFSAVDLARIYCEPENDWLHGHALWHLVSAASIGCIAAFYRRVFADARPDALR